MAVRASKGKIFIDYYMLNGKRRRVSLGWPDTPRNRKRAKKTEEEILENRRLQKLGIGKQPQNTDVVDAETLGDMLVRAKQDKGIKRWSVEHVRYAFKSLFEAVGNKPVTEYTEDDIIKTRDAMLKRLAQKTVYRHINLLKQGFDLWRRKNKGAGFVNPCEDVSVIIEEKEASHFTPDELAAFFEALGDDPAWQIPFMLQAYAGLRSAEVYTLAWEMVDLAGAKTSVRNAKRVGKQGRFRTVPLDSGLVSELSRIPAQQRGGPVFVMTNLRRKFNLACKAAGIERKRPGKHNLTMHSLRHTFGTEYQNRAKDISKTQRVLGHSDIRMTVKYTHPDVDDLRAGLREPRGE